MNRAIAARRALSGLNSGLARRGAPGRKTLGLLLLLALSAACSATGRATVRPTLPGVHPTDTTAPAAHPTDTTASTDTTVPAPTKSPAPTSTVTPMPTGSSAPASATPPPPTATDVPAATNADVGPTCPRPPDDYARVEVNGELLNARTVWLLTRATALYDGPGDLLRVTQGGYTEGQATSFGTHAGGGAVDISIRNPANPAEILWDEADAMVLALRRAGFAAWYRAPGDLGPGSPAHIHAIAVGDRELSPAAIEQLTGTSGYFRGLDGLPAEYGGPHPDRHGGPILCAWMIDLGYSELGE